MNSNDFRQIMLSYRTIIQSIDRLNEEYLYNDTRGNGFISNNDLEYLYNEKEKLCTKFHNAIIYQTLSPEETRDIAYRLVWLFNKNKMNTSILDEEKQAQ